MEVETPPLRRGKWSSNKLFSNSMLLPRSVPTIWEVFLPSSRSSLNAVNAHHMERLFRVGAIIASGTALS